MTNEEKTLAIAGASLSICESLLFTLIDNQQLSQKDVRGLLNDAIKTHRQEAAKNGEANFHENVLKIIEEIRDNKNSVKLFDRIDST